MKNILILALAGGTLLVGCSEIQVTPPKSKLDIPQTMTIRHDVYVHHSGSMDVKIVGPYGSDIRVEVKTK